MESRLVKNRLGLRCMQRGIGAERAFAMSSDGKESDGESNVPLPLPPTTTPPPLPPTTLPPPAPATDTLSNPRYGRMARRAAKPLCCRVRGEGAPHCVKQGGRTPQGSRGLNAGWTQVGIKDEAMLSQRAIEHREDICLPVVGLVGCGIASGEGERGLQAREPRQDPQEPAAGFGEDGWMGLYLGTLPWWGEAAADTGDESEALLEDWRMAHGGRGCVGGPRDGAEGGGLKKVEGAKSKLAAASAKAPATRSSAKRKKAARHWQHQRQGKS
ncbi:hypothetical protein DFH06DRAFT_1142877 [Mycena polygramma]|nr:hypothetical protein DFH06DRAFT_1142877 [Mycena polygramma]